MIRAVDTGMVVGVFRRFRGFKPLPFTLYIVENIGTNV